MSKLSDWTLAKLERRFGLRQIETHPVLDNLLQQKVEVSDFERQLLLSLRKRLYDNVLHWNEQELSLHFIGPLLHAVNFSSYEFNIFAERYLTGQVDGETITGYPDGLIAKGRREPEIPYFCLQEYKHPPFVPPDSGGIKGGEGDPVGQCLAAMLVAQELNQHHHPVYGCYILRRNWFFMVLQGREYAISHEYDATQDEIFVIFGYLKALKAMIAAWLEMNTSAITF